jgi:hypothetical protein
VPQKHASHSWGQIVEQLDERWIIAIIANHPDEIAQMNVT